MDRGDIATLRSTSAPGRARDYDEYGASEEKHGEEAPRPSVRFSAATWRNEEPKISVACKNFMAYRAAAAATEGRATRADADRAARVGILCARATMRAVNAVALEGGEAAAALAALPEGARATASFGRSFLRDPAVAAAVRSAPHQAGLDGEDALFADDFLRSALDDDDDLTWSPDYKQTLQRRHEARKSTAAARLATRDVPVLDPALAAEADAVHRAVANAGSEAGGDRPLPQLPRFGA